MRRFANITILRSVKMPLVAASLIVSLAVSTVIHAGEIRLRAESRHVGGLVLLDDVAEIFAATDEQQAQLAKVELFPAPAPGQERFVRVNEIQDLLVLRGVNLANHTIRGASQVRVRGAAGTIEATTPELRTSVLSRRQAHQRIRAALAAIFGRDAAGEPAWEYQFELDEKQIITVLQMAADSLAVETDRAALERGEPLVVVGQTAEGPVRLTIAARISQRPMVVVASRALPRGAVVQAADVRLEPVDAGTASPDLPADLELVVGRETTRAVTEGQLISSELLRRPLLVHRGEVVTVYARSSGVQVRTNGRAREDGSAGDLIMVESLLDRQGFFARVNGIQEVEVYARATRAPERVVPQSTPSIDVSNAHPMGHQPTRPHANLNPVHQPAVSLQREAPVAATNTALAVEPDVTAAKHPVRAQAASNETGSAEQKQSKDAPRWRPPRNR